MAFDDLLRAPKLFRVRIAAGLAPQGLALLGEGLLESDARTFGRAHHLVPRDLQQAAVHRVRDRFLLHRRIDDHALQLGGLDGLDLNCRLDAGLEQFLHARLPDGFAKAPDLGGVAGQPGLVVLLAAEELPDHVLAPALHQFLVAQIKAVLQVQQAGHQANGQTGPSGVAQACAEFHDMLTQQILGKLSPCQSLLVGKFGCQSLFD